MNKVYRKHGNKKTEVSVIISLYNYEIFIEKTLESVKRQTLDNFDLVIVEDCSTDNSLNVCEEWVLKNEKRFNNLLLYQNQSNQGLGITRNVAFSLTKTPFVFVLDADNILLSTCLERFYESIKRADVAFVHSYLEHFDESIGIGGLDTWNPQKLHLGNTIDAMVMIKREVWEKVGGYSEDMPINGWEDYELWFKLAEIGEEGIRIPEILCRYRVHNNSMLKNETNPNVQILWTYLENKHKSFFNESKG